MPIPLGILAVAGAGAGAASSFDLLETTVLGSDTASVTFSNLNTYTAYKHLQLRCTLRNSAAVTTSNNFIMNINGDTGANYVRHNLLGSGTTVTSGAVTSTTSMIVSNCAPGNSNTAGIFGALVMDILDFSSTNKNKTTRTFSGAYSGTEVEVTLTSHLWMSTSAMTSFALTTNSGNFVTGSRFSLYGVK